jgi:hypothetical protein
MPSGASLSSGSAPRLCSRAQRRCDAAVRLLVLDLHMDRALVEQHLAKAERHVAQGQTHVLRQRELITEFDRHGDDSTQARALLTLRYSSNCRNCTLRSVTGFRDEPKEV